MSRRDRPPPPTVAELTELALILADRAPHLFPVFLHSICRSTRMKRLCRELEPSGTDLAMLRKLDPRGEALIVASRKGAAWLRRRIMEERVLDELLPPW